MDGLGMNATAVILISSEVTIVGGSPGICCSARLEAILSTASATIIAARDTASVIGSPSAGGG